MYIFKYFYIYIYICVYMRVCIYIYKHNHTRIHTCALTDAGAAHRGHSSR